jgi:hypothetical protein
MKKLNPAGKNDSSSPYDRILKENLVPLIPVIMKKVLHIEVERMEYLPMTKQQKTREREPDFACLIWNERFPGGAVFHLEFETSAKALPLYRRRMLDYYAIFYQKTGKPILQNLLFFGSGKPGVKNEVNHPNLSFRFPVFYLSEVSYTEFIDSEKSEEVILSILANFLGEKPEDIVTQVIARIAWLQRNNKLELQRLTQQLEVISQLRNLQSEITK